jgi:hypothetical protein
MTDGAKRKRDQQTEAATLVICVSFLTYAVKT